MAFDPLKNFIILSPIGYYSSNDTTITLSNSDYTLIQDMIASGQFNLTWWNITDYAEASFNDPNLEIVRVTGGDSNNKTITIVRGQEGTVASDKNIIGKQYVMIQSFTAKLYYDIINALGSGSTITATASEDLSAGDFVNLYLDTSVLKVRKAVANPSTVCTQVYEAHGFITNNVTNGNTVTVYLSGINNALTGLTIGRDYYLSNTAGVATSTLPDVPQAIYQKVGKALSPTSIYFAPSDLIYKNAINYRSFTAYDHHTYGYYIDYINMTYLTKYNTWGNLTNTLMEFAGSNTRDSGFIIPGALSWQYTPLTQFYTLNLTVMNNLSYNGTISSGARRSIRSSFASNYYNTAYVPAGYDNSSLLNTILYVSGTSTSTTSGNLTYATSVTTTASNGLFKAYVLSGSNDSSNTANTITINNSNSITSSSISGLSNSFVYGAATSTINQVYYTRGSNGGNGIDCIIFSNNTFGTNWCYLTYAISTDFRVGFNSSDTIGMIHHISTYGTIETLNLFNTVRASVAGNLGRSFSSAHVTNFGSKGWM